MVLVVGSGAAGMMAAIGAAELGDVTLVSDGAIGKSNTAMAQGGVQCPLDSDASRRSFREDILRSARCPLNDVLLDDFIRSAFDVVRKLDEWGLKFDCGSDRAWRRSVAGGMSEARVLSVKDRIGPSLVKVLLNRMEELDVDALPNTAVRDFRQEGSEMIVSLENRQGAEWEMRCRSLVICTGGATSTVARLEGEISTNPTNRNHGMINLLRSKELEETAGDSFQYQPLGILHPGITHFGKAVPETVLGFSVEVRAAGGRLIKSRDERPDRLELVERMSSAERDGEAVESDSGHRGFYLQLDEMSEELIAERFPALLAHCRKHDLNVAKLLVRPFLHYQLGGFRVERYGATSIPGLFLAGEMVGGLHGRNRLMGNGLTDSLVNGYLAGKAAAVLDSNAN